MRCLLLAAGAAVLLAGGPSHPAVAQAAPAAPAAASAAKPVDATERRQVITELAKTLEANFVFPETGQRYAAMLRANLASGAYEAFSDPAAFGAQGHRRPAGGGQGRAPEARHPQAFETRRPAPADAPASTRPSGPPGLEEAKMIGDVAYLRFNEFPEDRPPSPRPLGTFCSPTPTPRR